MKTEKELQEQLRRSVISWAWEMNAVWVFEPVENILNKGTFDVFMGVGGFDAWVELKVAGPNAKPDMRAGQPGFGHRMLKGGVRAFVLVGHPDGSCRLLAGRTMGSDWRDHLIDRFDAVDERVVRSICWSSASQV